MVKSKRSSLGPYLCVINSMEKILTNGEKVLIDDEFSYLFEGKKWFAQYPQNGKYKYAASNFKIDGKWKIFYLHRIIARPKDKEFVDHINGNTLDCRKCNLRISNNKLNQANQKRVRGKSIYKGVSLENGKWRARIRIDGKKTHLGLFNNEIEAAQAYDKAALKQWGDHAGLNFIDKKEK